MLPWFSCQMHLLTYSKVKITVFLHLVLFTFMVHLIHSRFFMAIFHSYIVTGCRLLLVILFSMKRFHNETDFTYYHIRSNVFFCVCERMPIPSMVVPLTESSCYISTEFRIQERAVWKRLMGKSAPFLNTRCIKSVWGVNTASPLRSIKDTHRRVSWEDDSAQHQDTHTQSESVSLRSLIMRPEKLHYALWVAAYFFVIENYRI